MGYEEHRKRFVLSFISTHLLAVNCNTKGALHSHIYKGKLFHTGSVAKVNPLQNLLKKGYKTSTCTEMKVHLETGRSITRANPIRQNVHTIATELVHSLNWKFI